MVSRLVQRGRYCASNGHVLRSTVLKIAVPRKGELMSEKTSSGSSRAVRAGARWYRGIVAVAMCSVVCLGLPAVAAPLASAAPTMSRTSSAATVQGLKTDETAPVVAGTSLKPLHSTDIVDLPQQAPLPKATSSEPPAKPLSGPTTPAQRAIADRMAKFMSPGSTSTSSSSAPSTPSGTGPTPSTRGYQPHVSQQIVADDSQDSTTYSNPDGTLTMHSYPYPVHYQDSAGQWHDIDTTLSADPSVAGGLVSGTNTWQVHFAPIGGGGGITVDSGGRSVTFVPDGANQVSPTINPSDPSSAIYEDAWTDANLEYTVTSSGLREDILIDAPGAPTTYSFATPGTALGSAGTALGGSSQGLPTGWTFRAPTAIDHEHLPQLGAAATLSASSQGVNVSVSPTWLGAEPASSFPVDIDPTIEFGPYTVTDVDNSGKMDSFCWSSTTAGDSFPYACPVTMGNDGIGWTTMDNFLYPIDTSSAPSDWNMSWPWEPVVTNATITLGGTTNPGGTTPSGNGYINVYRSTAISGQSYPFIKTSLTSPLASAPQSSGATNETIEQSAPIGGGTGYVEWSGCSGTPDPGTTLVQWEQYAMCNWSTSNDSCYTLYSTPYGCGGYWTFADSSESGGNDNYDLNGPYQAYTDFDLSITYDEPPTMPTLSSAPADGSSASGNSITLSATAAGSDPNGDTVDDRLVLMEGGGSTSVSSWSPSYSWAVNDLEPGALYYWAVESTDGTTSVISSNGWFYGPAVAGQTSPNYIAPTDGPIGPDGFGGWDPSCASASPSPSIVNGPYGINPANGDLVESSTDISVPGAGMALGLSRTYDNGLAISQVSNSTSPGPLGYGWSYNLGMSVTTNTSGVTVNQENGSEISFTAYSSTNPLCQAAFNYCPTEPRVLATLNHNSNSTWTFQRDNTGQTTFTFSSAGALTGEQDAAGDALTAASEATGVGACPSSAASCTVWTNSRSGRALTLAFDSSSPPRLLSATDGAGNTVSYCYFGQSCASGASGGSAQDLYSATQPGGAKTTYAYDSANSNTSLRHDILTEVTPTGATVSNSYSTSPPGQVTVQTAPSGDVTLTYDPSTAVVGGVTVPTEATYVCDWPVGSTGTCPTTIGSGTTPQETEYQYSGGALVAETSPQTTSSGTVVPVTQYDNLNSSVLVANSVQSGNGDESSNTLQSGGTPEQAGNIVTSTDAMGNTTEYQYNSYNRAICQVAPSEYLYSMTLCPISTTVTASGTLPQSTISATSASSFTDLAHLAIVSGAGVQNVVCTGSTSSTLTGCSGGTGTIGVGTPVVQAAAALAPGANPWPGATVNLYNASDQLVMTVDPLGRTTVNSYTPSGLSVPAGLQYCSVSSVEYAASVACPAYGAARVSGTTSSTFDSAGDVLSETKPDGVYAPLGWTVTSGSAAGLSGSTDKNISPTLPTSVSGDMLAAVIYYAHGDTLSAPSGWTRRGSAVTDGHASYAFYTAPGAGSPGTTWTESASHPNYGYGQIYNLHPSSGTAGVDVEASGTSQTSSSVTGPALSTTAANDLMLSAVSGYYSGTASTLTAPSGYASLLSDSDNNSQYDTFGVAWATAGAAASQSAPTWPFNLTASPGIAAGIAFSASGSTAPYETTTFAYTDSAHPGLPTVTTDPDGDVTTVVYDSAGQVTSSTVSFGSYTATTLSAYTTAGQLYCTVSPINAANGVVCPTSPPLPSSPPADVTSNFYNTNGQMVQTTSPIGGTTIDAYDQAGQQYCTVGPQAFSNGVSCPTSEPTTAPTATDDPYLGATITSYDSAGQVVQVTNPLGGITTSAYDGDGNLVTQSVESASASTPAIAAVGSPDATTGYLGASSYALPDSPETVGDLLVLAVLNDTWPESVTSVSGGGVTTWASAGPTFWDGSDGEMEQILVRDGGLCRVIEYCGHLDR